MTFRYTDPHLLQNVGPGVVLAGILGVMLHPTGQSLWSRYVEWAPYWFQVVGGLFVLHGAIFWGLGAFFAIVDKTDRPGFVARHRIQRGRRKRPPLARVLKLLALNQLILTPLSLAAIAWMLALRGWSPSAELPSVLTFFLHLVGLAAFSLIYFYITHRFLHRKYWMKKVHRIHHEYKTPAAISAEYAHPLEFVFGNFGTLGGGVILLAPDLFTIYAFTILGTLSFVVHHSGYALPWYSWSVHHDWHHYKMTEAFGTIGLIDPLLGTDPELRKLEHGQEV